MFRLISKKTSKPVSLIFCEGNTPVIGEFLHKGHVTWNAFPRDYVIMIRCCGATALCAVPYMYIHMYNTLPAKNGIFGNHKAKVFDISSLLKMA